MVEKNVGPLVKVIRKAFGFPAGVVGFLFGVFRRACTGIGSGPGRIKPASGDCCERSADPDPVARSPKTG